MISEFFAKLCDLGFEESMVEASVLFLDDAPGIVQIALAGGK